MSESHAVEVLLVEDNPTDAELTLRALRGKELRNSLVVVEDGAEALDFLFARGRWSGRDAARGPRMVLLDLRLPRVDGIEVLRQVKADERTRRIPVVILTSSRQDPDMQRCDELGANSYIVKPVDFEKFAVAVADVGFYWILLDEPPRSGR
jgi:two-component system response regulator